MPGVSEAIGKLLDRGEQISAQPGFLRPIDTKGLARSLNIDAESQVNGSNELPETGASELDSKEKEIVQYLLSEYHWQADEFYSQLRAYSNRLTQFSIRAEFQRLRILAQDTLARLRAASSQAEADLGPKFELFRERRQELDDFRKKHRLARPARDASGMVFTVGLLVFLAAIESALNGVFFSQGSDLGLLGGIGTAIGISLVNVTAAFLAGLGPARWLFHRNWLLKLVALILLLAYVAATFGLQAFAAHFRDASAQLEGSEAFRTAVASLWSNPFRLQDINSYYLVGLGLVFSLFAFLKGLFGDDPYPGYGATSRRYIASRDDYSNEHDALFNSLEDAKDTCIEELDSGVAKLPKYPQAAAEIHVQRTAIAGKFKAYETGLEEAVNQLLSRYRQRNKAHRNTAPPGYFGEKWTLPQRVSESAEAKALQATAPEPDLNIDAMLGELNELAGKVLDTYSGLVERYPHPTRLTDGKKQEA
ncbi:MAG: hypothetical protein KDJ29_19970 [Hyphomicrobiales bacterium]|nr:hypothetical protein [Nitratireductor sp.]MCC2099177.1 hypothetical protein [Hyphomicrobiales bacterium]